MRDIDYTKGVGLNLDDIENNRADEGSVSFALNATVTSTKNEGEYAYQTEAGNKLFLKFEEGEKPVGVFYVGAIGKTIYFLDSNKIGLEDNGTYSTLVEGECLGFHPDHPIHQIQVKVTNKTVQIYWTDNLNTMRFIDLEELPFVEIPNPNNDYQTIKLEGQLDCNKLKVMPDFKMPKIENISVEEGGEIKEGTVQFGAAYSNEKGHLLTSVYNITNPLTINERGRATQDYDLISNRAVRFYVRNLEKTGIFKYFSVIVVETINGISTSKLLGTYPVANGNFEILYTGDTERSLTVPEEELLRKFPYYKYAQGVTESDGNIIWYGLREDRKINYQQIWNKVKTNWVTVQLPYNDENEGYGKPENTLKYKSFMRDEIYPLEGVFQLTNGRETEAFHIPSRVHNSQDIENVDGKDVMPEDSDRCEEDVLALPRWKVYNTGTVTETDPNFNPNDNCYEGVYQRGEFAYVESEELYPNNPDIWGDLASKPIRHHKFPDEVVSPRFLKRGDDTFIYPIGVEIDRDSLLQAIEDSDLTQEEKDSIVGVKILRGDRSVGNMSIMAKGHLYNVGKYHNEEDEERFFPNYPFNSLEADPLFAEEKVEPLKGYQIPKSLRAYRQGQGKDQFTFHSPDTHFGRVSSIDSGTLKIEAIDYGRGRGEIVPIKENAEYKFLTQNTQKYSLVLATSMALEYKSKKGIPSFNGSDFAQVYSNMNDLFEKLVPYSNFGKAIHSVAEFDKSYPVPNEGYKQRRIEFGKYLANGVNAIEEGKLLNNTNRESSVYLKTSEPLKYANEYSSEIPMDLSKFIKSTQGAREPIEMEEFFYLGKKRVIDTPDGPKEALNAGFFQSVIVGASMAGDEVSDNVNDAGFLTSWIAQVAMQIAQDYTYDEYLEFENQIQACWDENFPVKSIELDTGGTLIKTEAVFNVSGEEINGNQSDLKSPEYLNNFIPVYTTNNTTYFFNSAIEDIELTLSQEVEVENFHANSPWSATTGIQKEIDKIYIAYNYFMRRSGINAFADWSNEPVYYKNEKRAVCGGVVMTQAFKAIQYARDIYMSHFQLAEEEQQDNLTRFDVNNYYASIKRNKPSQWGQMYSYTTVDTGTVNRIDTEFEPIFGGDTFINRFSLKRKQQVFNRTTVKEHDGTDIALDEEGALGYPMFWISTKPLDMNLRIDEEALNTSFSGIGAKIKTIVAASALDVVANIHLLVGMSLLTYGSSAYIFPPAGVIVSIVGLAVTAVGAILKVVSAILRNKTSEIEKATIKILRDLVLQIAEKFGIKNVNLDRMKGVNNSIKILGDVYQYVYGIPTTFVESQVNVSERKATDEDIGNYYPRVIGDKGIPNDWLQEARVPILNDNSYHYNKTFSKQNRESFYSHLQEDFDASEDYTKKYLNRAIYSDKEDVSEDFNTWRVYKPVSFYDFPKNFGKITSIDGVGSKQVLVRFEDNTQIYNAQSQLNVQGIGVYLGDPSMFTSAPPVDIGEGSQHRMLINSPYGKIYINAKGGKVLLVGGQNPMILSDLKVRRWFQRHLPFETEEDNHYKGVTGLHGIFDPVHNRILITKIEEGKSWTLSFSFISNRWISWHSYIPNYYVGEDVEIRAGENNKEFKYDNKGIFRTFFDRIYPFIIEFPFANKGAGVAVVQSIEDFSTVERFDEYGDGWEEDDIKFFNKAMVYNRMQNSGVLELIPKDPNDLSQYFNYPKSTENSTEILLDKRDGGYRFNQFHNKVIKNGVKIIKNPDKPVEEEIEFEDGVLSYDSKGLQEENITSRNTKVRLIHDTKENDIRITSDIITTTKKKSDL